MVGEPQVAMRVTSQIWQVVFASETLPVFCFSLRKKAQYVVVNTKFKRVQFQDEGTPFIVWDFHHDDVGSMSNLRTVLEVVLCSFMRLEARKMYSCMTP